MKRKGQSSRFTLVEPGVQEFLNFCRREPQTVIHLLGKLWHFYLKRFVPETAFGGHSDYVRFVTIGRSRTGSNLLRGSLMSHSRVVVLGDVFRGRTAIEWGVPFYPRSKRMLSLIESDPVRFLETKVFARFPARVSAVGFKTIYPHRYAEKWIPVKAYLANQRDYRILHIKRRNILKTHLSLMRVIQHKGKWKDISGNGRADSPIMLEYESCLEAFENTRRWEGEYDVLFKDHPKLDVVYEELVSDFAGEMRRIQEFLSVDYEVVKPLTYKQSSRPLCQAILNYFELKERFSGTPWEAFFED